MNYTIKFAATLTLLGTLFVPLAQAQDKIERVDPDALRSLFEISGPGKPLYTGTISGFLSQGQLVCVTGATTATSFEAESAIKIVGRPVLKVSSARVKSQTYQDNCGSRYGHGMVSEVASMVFTEILGAKHYTANSYEYVETQKNMTVECKEGELVEIGAQGVWPVTTFIPKNRPMYEAGSQVIREKSCNSSGDSYAKEKTSFGMGIELAKSGTGQAIPKINSEAANVGVQINFGRLLQGGSQFKMQLQMTGFSSLPLRDLKLESAQDDRVTWEGNFRLVDCTDSEGLKEAGRGLDKIASFEQLIQRRNEMALPGYRTCTFAASKMTTKTVAQWNENKKAIIPTLRDVVIEVNAASANVRFMAYNGIPFQGQQIVSVKTQGSAKSVEAVVLKAERLLEIMNGSLDQVWEDYRSSDVLIPKTMAYFNLRKEVIQNLVQNLDVELKSGDLPFMAALEVMVTLKKAWAFIDRSVGLATRNEKSLQNIMTFGETSFAGSYFNPQDANLIKPFAMPKREIPVYNTSESSSSFGFGGGGHSGRPSRHGDEAP